MKVALILLLSFFFYENGSIFSQENTVNEPVFKVAPLPRPVNSDYNEFGPSLTGDGKTMYFYSKRNTSTNTDIFQTKFINGAWSNPVEVRELNSPYDDQSPFVHPEEKFIIFSSNRDGSIEFRIPQGIGVSRDLYYSEKVNGVWARPAQLSSTINTEEMEENPHVYGDHLFFTRYPFGNPAMAKVYRSRISTLDLNPAIELPESINQPGTATLSAVVSPDGNFLYFSSNREGGYGGFDIYRARIYDDGTFGEPENLGPEINTAADEAYMIVSSADNNIYFCRRNQNANRDYDIYSAKRLKEEVIEKEEIAQKNIPPLRPNSGKPSFKNEKENLVQKKPPTGNIAMNNPPKGKSSQIPKDTMPEIKKPEPPKKVDKEMEKITETLKEKKKLTLNNVNFEINSSELLLESLPVLNTIIDYLKDNKELKIKVTGHTDLTGDLEFNQQLSWDRAESVKNYFIKRGISKERILTDGKGSTQPIIKDTKPESNKVNRRTEFEIVE